MKHIQAIETRYDGYRFRSRLEARWAVFFNSLHVPYCYEPEGFNLRGEWYLCDFWLPSQKAWVEVKGVIPTQAEVRKIVMLWENTKCVSAYIFFGAIPHPNKWRRTWKTVSIRASRPLFTHATDAQLSRALRQAREARF